MCLESLQTLENARKNPTVLTAASSSALGDVLRFFFLLIFFLAGSLFHFDDLFKAFLRTRIRSDG